MQGKGPRPLTNAAYIPPPVHHSMLVSRQAAHKRAWAQIWRHAIILTSEAMLEGLSKVKGRCTVVGRAQMSADLQEAVHALRAVAPVSRETTAALEALLFLNDGYIKVRALCMLLCRCLVWSGGCVAAHDATGP